MKRPSGAAIWKWLRRAIYGAAGLVVLLLVLLAGAQTYFNTDSGRARLASMLSGVLGQDLAVGGLDLHLLSGFTLKDVRLTPRGELADHPFLIADEVILGYSLSELTHRTLRIDRLAVSGAKIDLVMRGGRSNIPLASKPAEAPPTVIVVVQAPAAPVQPPAPEPAPPESPKPRGLVLPRLPLTVQLDELRLADVAMVMDLEGVTHVESRSLDLDLHGHAGPRGVDLTLAAAHRPGEENRVRVAIAGQRPVTARSQLDLALHLTGKDLDSVSVDLALALPGADVDLGSGPKPVTVKLTAKGSSVLSNAVADFESVRLDLGGAGALDLHLELADFLGAPRVNAAIPTGSLILEELVPLLAPFLPDLSASGRIEFERVVAKGDLGGGTPEAPFEASGRIVLRDVAVALPGAGVEAKDLDATLDLSSVELVHYLPVELAAAGHLSLARAALPSNGALEGVEVTLESTAAGGDFRDVHAKVAVTAARVIPPGLGAGAKPMALDAHVIAAADLTTGNLTGIDATVTVPGALTVQARGDVGAFGKGPVKLVANVEAKPGPLLAFVPPALLGGLEKPTAGGALRIDAEVEGDLGAGALGAHGKLVLDRLALAGLPASAAVGSASGELAFQAALGAGFRPGASRVEGKLTFEGVRAIDAVQVKSATLAIQASADAIPPTAVSAEVDLNVRGAAYRSKDLETPPQDARLTLKASGDPLRGDLVLDSLDLAVDRVARITAKARTRGFGREQLEGRLKLDGVNLATLALRAPKNVSAAIAGISATGSPTLEVTASGRLPTPDELESLSLPLTAKLAFDLPQGSLAWPAHGIQAPRIATKLALVLEPKRIAVDLDASAFGLVDQPDLGPEPKDVAIALHASLDDRDRLELKQAQLSILDRGAFAFAGGKVSGLRPILEKRALPPVGEILRSVAAELETAAGFARPSASEVAAGVTVKGGASARLGVKLRPGRDLAIEGQAYFSDLYLEQRPSLDLRGLTGRFPIQKTLQIVTADAKGAPAKGGSEAAQDRNRALYGSLRALSANRDNLRVAALQAGPLAAHDIYFDVEFADRALKLSRFGMGLLGGWIGGSAETAFSPARNRILLEANFGEVNLKELLPIESDLADEDAQVSGTSRLALDLARGERGRAVSLGDVNADVNLTRIGERALDQLLAFLDPKGDNGSITTFRRILTTTDLTIDRVHLPIQNGSLTVRVEYGIHGHVPRFLENALNVVYDTKNHFEVPAIDLLRLSNVEKLQALFTKLETLKPILDIVGGDRIRIEPDGSFRIE